jgi:DEAD/DEAH box helicase domain-containing protein
LHIIERLTSKGLLHISNGKFLPDFNKAMSILRDFSIRGIGSGTDIFFSGKLVAERSMPQALEELHDNAIYFLSGKRYQVKKLHFDPKKERRSYAELIRIPDDYPYYTKSVVDEMPTVLSTYEHKRAIGIEVKYCSLKIQKRVLGYSNIEIGQEVAKGTKVTFENPIEFQFITKGLVFRAPRPVNTLKNANDEQYVEMSGYHASEHVIIEGSTMITGGASQDLGGISLGSTGLIFIYDGTIGGNGASRILYDKFENALERSLRILTECSCRSESGCPRCTYSYKCGNNNEYLHKVAAIEVLKRVSEREETHVEDAVPMDRTLV